MEPKAQTVPRQWIIEYVNGGPNWFQLVNCKIYRDAAGDYQFRGPRGTVRATMLAPGNIPFNLPPFTAQLGGAVERTWYIQVTHVDDQQMRGTWGNNGYHESERVVHTPSEDPPDTWTALADQGAQVGQKEKDKDRVKDASASA